MKILRVDEVVALIRVSRMTLFRWERAGAFPRRIALGPNSVGYREEEIREWVAARGGPGSTISGARRATLAKATEAAREARRRRREEESQRVEAGAR